MEVGNALLALCPMEEEMPDTQGLQAKPADGESLGF